MGLATLRFGLICAVAWFASANWAIAQDWPQWRGPNRDAKATAFNGPANWPAELSRQWKVTVGDGVATPAVVGDRVYVFSREGEDEVLRALDAATGDELWQDKYEAEAPRGGASNYPGPRSSPAVVDGKVVTLGVQGTLCAHDAQRGDLLWRKDEFNNEVPDFNVASSPIIVDGIVIAQLGGEDDGGIVAYDLASGDERWRWTEDPPAYGSPVLMTIDGKKTILAPTDEKLVALGASDGKTVWEIPYQQGGRYNTMTPIVTGNTMIIAGPGSGVSAIRLTMSNGPEPRPAEERVWRNTDNSLQFNSPVLKDGLLFGLSSAGQLFCINTQNGEQTAWAAPINPQAEAERRQEERSVENARGVKAQFELVRFVQQDDRERPERDGREGFDRDRRRGEGRGRDGRGGGRGRRGRGGGGYGSIVDAGDVMLALSPAGELVVFKPTDEAYTEVARYKVAEEGTYAYPVPVGDAIYIKDRDSVTRWQVE
jgi:outer membrane protein assembly factor BamB